MPSADTAAFGAAGRLFCGEAAIERIDLGSNAGGAGAAAAVEVVPPAGFAAAVEAVSVLLTGAGAGGDRGGGAATSALGGVPVLPVAAEAWPALPGTRIWVGISSLLAESMASWPACAYGGATAGAVLLAGAGCGLLPSEEGATGGAAGVAVKADDVDDAAASCFAGDADAVAGGVAEGAAEPVAAGGAAAAG